MTDPIAYPIAICEAAHGVIARALGFDVTSMLVTDTFGETNVRHRDHEQLRAGVAASEPASLQWVEDTIVYILAEPAASHVLLGRSGEYEVPILEDFGEHHDPVLAFRLAETISPPMGARATCERLFARAIELVRQHRADIETVAAAIVAHGGRLVGSEMEEALAKP